MGNWRGVELKDFVAIKDNKNNVKQLINNQWKDTAVYKPVSMAKFGKANKNSFNSMNEVISFMKNQNDPVSYVNIPIDFNNLDYELKIYDSRNFDEFKQMAIDITWDGIHLNEREQQIWRNKLMALLPSYV